MELEHTYSEQRRSLTITRRGLGRTDTALRLCDVVVMDNLAARKVAGVSQAIQAVGASILYLPQYSLDLNPIEQNFAKIKALLRKAAARTKDALWTSIGKLLG